MRYRVAILDMNNAVPNQGMRCIKELVNRKIDVLDWKVFDVRNACQVPGTDYDIYISSGGPGSPMDGDGVWDKKYYDLLSQLWQHNQNPRNQKKKYVFFICHSFQMACIFFEIGTITQRKNTSFGVLPIFKTRIGEEDNVLIDLPDPYFAVDARDWQVTDPDPERLEELGAHILSIERPRAAPNLKRAIMAIRFSQEFFGTQFHPEADAEGMLLYYQMPEKKLQTKKAYGEVVYQEIIAHLNDPDKIELTHNTILPSFLEYALTQLNRNVLVSKPG